MNAKPNLFVSRCLEIDACRYNGQKIPNSFLAKLFPFVNVVTTCPEVEIGLGIPRDPIRLVQNDGTIRLLQPSTGKDLTKAMRQFGSSYLDSLTEVDGFVLKAGSPSCGVKDVKIFNTIEKAPAVAKGAGMFAHEVLKRFNHLAIEDEGWLTNFRIREHFLTRLFAQANFRHVAQTGKMADLVKFHSNNKYLLMAYNQKEMRILGRIVANPEKQPVKNVLKEYGVHLSSALSRVARRRSNVNVLQHVLGYFSDMLTRGEKQHFLELVAKYVAGQVPLSVCQAILKSWIIRHQQRYLMDQTYFSPFPEELIEISDSGRGRDF